MLCDICKQQQATVHLTEIVDDQMSELHLCETCASEKGAQMESHFGLADLLAGLADFGGKSAEEDRTVSTQRCGQCDMGYADFKKLGRLGCSECYTAFRKNLSTLLRRIHGAVTHTGKVPVTFGGTTTTAGRNELQTLRRQLQQAVEAEQFEEAAKLRDQIRTVEQVKHKPTKKPSTRQKK